MHTLLDLRGNIPSFIYVSDGKLHDVHALDKLLPEAGAIYVMDRGYVDFARLHVLHQVGAFFVTRAKVEYRCPPGLCRHRQIEAQGVIADQTIAMDGYLTQRHYPGAPAGGSDSGTRGPRKTLIFLTNQVTLPKL